MTEKKSMTVKKNDAKVGYISRQHFKGVPRVQLLVTGLYKLEQ
jgi:hypothetical protein